MSIPRADRALQKHPELIDMVREGRPIHVALACLALPDDLEGPLADHKQIRAARAEREWQLWQKVETGSKDERDAALVILRAEFGARFAANQSVAEAFSDLGHAFHAWCCANPDATALAAYAEFHRLATRRSQSAHEKRAAHKRAKPGE